MKIIIKEPNKQPYIKEIEDDLKVEQNIVGGCIEVVPMTFSMVGKILMVCNEDGKHQGLPHNFFYGTDNVVGTVFFVGDNNDHTEFIGLIEEEIKEVMSWFE